MHIGASMFFTDYSMTPAELALALEERGFESVWAPEHSHIPVSRKTPFPGGGELPKRYFDAMDPFVTLASAATVTKKLMLGTGVCLVNQRDPIELAKLVASIDQVSRGRFLFGVGIGWNQDEMENHGTDFKTRAKLVRERIEAMKEIWSRSKAEYHGEFVNFDPIFAWPKPVQKPNPPIHVGGAFPQGARRAIRYGNGWIPVAGRGSLSLEEQISAFRQMCAEANRDPAEVPITSFGVKEDGRFGGAAARSRTGACRGHAGFGEIRRDPADPGSLGADFGEGRGIGPPAGRRGAPPRFDFGDIGVCNLYSMTHSRDAIRRLFRVEIDRTANQAPLPAIFPDQLAPVVRQDGDGRVMQAMRWGFPPPPGLGSRPVTNVRNVASAYWRGWLQPSFRCLVPATAFCEYAEGQSKMPHWFALAADRPPFAFAGIWRPWTGTRRGETGEHLLFSFLTTEANALMRPIHPKAMPVILTGADWDAWLTGDLATALALQAPAAEHTLTVVATGQRQDDGI